MRFRTQNKHGRSPVHITTLKNTRIQANPCQYYTCNVSVGVCLVPRTHRDEEERANDKRSYLRFVL